MDWYPGLKYVYTIMSALTVAVSHLTVKTHEETVEGKNTTETLLSKQRDTKKASPLPKHGRQQEKVGLVHSSSSIQHILAACLPNSPTIRPWRRKLYASPNCQQTPAILHGIPEHSTLHSRFCENLISHMSLFEVDL
jgi:hypothetical protein